MTLAIMICIQMLPNLHWCELCSCDVNADEALRHIGSNSTLQIMQLFCRSGNHPSDCLVPVLSKFTKLKSLKVPASIKDIEEIVSQVAHLKDLQDLDLCSDYFHVSCQISCPVTELSIIL